MYLLKHFNSSCDLASPGTAYKSFCSNSFLNPNQNKGSTQLKKLYTSSLLYTMYSSSKKLFHIKYMPLYYCGNSKCGQQNKM